MRHALHMAAVKNLADFRRATQVETLYPGELPPAARMLCVAVCETGWVGNQVAGPIIPAPCDRQACDLVLDIPLCWVHARMLLDGLPVRFQKKVHAVLALARGGKPKG